MQLVNMETVSIHRACSSAVVQHFEDNYFDWIYIDGNHSYEYVKADLESFLPKIKSGGYLTGDDYLWAPEEQLPVKRAVAEFVDRAARD
jgi:predicted O-methyltransferase YrrM